MSENEDPIHDFFRKAADRYSIDFNEGDWANMEKRFLEDARKRRLIRWRTYGAVFVTLLLVGTAIGYWTTIGRERQKSVDLPVEKEFLRDNKPSMTQRDKIADKDNAIALRHAFEKNLAAPPHPSQSEVRKIDSPYESDTSITRAIYDLENDSTNMYTSSTINGDSNRYPNAEKDSVQGIESLRTVGRRSEIYGRWSLAAVAAPDFSSVDGKQYTKPGGETGILFLYHISDLFSVGSGILGGRKVYNASGDLYHTPEGYWNSYTNGNVPRQIHGECTIVELPLMIRYQKNFRRSNWHIVAGISSYFMFDESYRYLFDPGAQVNGVTGRRPSQSSNYLFNVGSASFGYEQSVLPNLFVGVEPYVKIPFAGMGWPNVKLFSGGAYVTVRYQFGKGAAYRNNVLSRQTNRMLNFKPY